MKNGRQVKPSTPEDPRAVVLNAFHSYQIVALGESHGSEQDSAFRISLIEDPRFADRVNDIVVEFGNSRYQDLMDRYLQGDNVPSELLRQVWQNTTQPNTVWDRPIYEKFFRKVRQVNDSLPKLKKLRVLLGDPPVDWSRINSPRDFANVPDRDEHAANIIRTEVLTKHHRALIIYGNLHFQRKTLGYNYESPHGFQTDSLVNLIEKGANTPVFTIFSNTDAELALLQENIKNWPRPSISVLLGTALGEAECSFFIPYVNQRIVIRNGQSVIVPKEQWNKLAMEDQFNAVLYFGPRSSLTESVLSPKLCQDSGYLKMRFSRMSKFGPGLQEDIQQIKNYCLQFALGS